MMTKNRAVTKIVSLLTSFFMIFMMSAIPSETSSSEDVTNNQLKEMANELAFQLNELREENGLHPLYVVPYLCDVSAVRSRESIVSFGHQRPDGSRFSTAVDANLVPYSVIFENLAAGSNTPEDAMNQWKNSEKHLSAMLNPDATHLGVGVAYEGNSDYGWYWEQLIVICNEDIPDQYIPSRYEIIPQAVGDVTGDDVIDTYDYLMLADYIYKRKNNIPVYLNDAQLEAADCFKDGIITESDAKAMVRYILGEYNSLPFVF